MYSAQYLRSNLLLGGKLVACLLRSREVYDDFARLYRQDRGHYLRERRGEEKKARLLAITTTSSLGRSFTI